MRRDEDDALDANLGVFLPPASTGTMVSMDEDFAELTPGALRFMAGSAGYDELRFDRCEPAHADGNWLIERLMGRPD